MSMNTGENEQGLRKVIDLTRMISIVLLLLHCYYYCYAAFQQWHLTVQIGDKILKNISRTGLFDSFNKSKGIAAAFLVLSLLGIRGRKSEKISYQTALLYFFLGLAMYFGSILCFRVSFTLSAIAITYLVTTAIGYVLIITGGGLLTRIIKVNLSKDVFNTDNQTFPQEERLLKNDDSINLPAVYNLKGKQRKSWINFINPMRGMLIMGSPGSGKSYFIIQHIIRQHIEKGFSMFVYDFKYDDLTKIAYNHFLKHKSKYAVEPKFYVINFDDLSRSYRCNPLHPDGMMDITDAVESARTILLGLNRSWIKKQGEFFIESPINFITAIIWFLRKYRGGEFCTLPHVIELAQVDHDKLFSILRTEPEIEAYINPFISAYQSGAAEQLEGQIDAAKIGMARLSSPILYYVMTGNDFTLDINNPVSPKIVCLANNPQKQEVYGAVLSLYVSRMTKLVNQRGKLKSSLIFDEFPTIYFRGIDTLIATARSNKVATTVAVQDYSQLKNEYSREGAEVIMNIMGNVISGQVSGETAKFLSEKFGRILQDRESISINASDTSVSKSKQLEQAVPASVISSLSSGEFVGIVADNPDEEITLKAFHSKIINDRRVLAKEEGTYQGLPLFRQVSQSTVQRNFYQVKEDIQNLIETKMESLLHDPAKSAMIVRKV